MSAYHSGKFEPWTAQSQPEIYSTDQRGNWSKQSRQFSVIKILRLVWAAAIIFLLTFVWFSHSPESGLVDTWRTQVSRADNYTDELLRIQINQSSAMYVQQERTGALVVILTLAVAGETVLRAFERRDR